MQVTFLMSEQCVASLRQPIAITRVMLVVVDINLSPFLCYALAYGAFQQPSRATIASLTY
jgi:hypothetical protein